MIDTYTLKNKAPNNNGTNNIFLIDGSGFIFRAYHALPPLTNPHGVPVNAVMGFTNMLSKLISDMEIKNIAVVFDAARKNFRYDIYPEYKANRSETPEDLAPQFPLIRKATEAFSIPSIEKEGYEADDIIASYVKQAEKTGLHITIVSSDKDLMQLLGPNVSLFDPMKYKYMGEAEVLEKFGVTPDKVVDVQALAGDSSDNIPGVPGIGLKTAAQLINEYGDLETLLARASEIKQNKRRESLIEFADKARLSKQLVQLATDVQLPLKLEDIKIKTPDRKKLFAFLEDQGFKSILSRMERKFPATAENEQELEASSTLAYELVQDEDTLRKWVKMAHDAGIVAIDTETTALTPSKAKLVGISMAVKEKHACYIPLNHRDSSGYNDSFDFDNNTKPEKSDLKQIPIEKALAIFKPLLEDNSIIKIGHNFKYDMQMFMPYGIDINNIDDTMLMSYVLDGSMHSHSMDNLAKEFLNIDTIKFGEVTGKGKNQITFDLVPLDKALAYAAEDADVTLQLYHVFKPRLKEEKMEEFYENFEKPLVKVIAEMEMNGIKIDVPKLKEISKELDHKISSIAEEVYKLAGGTFNIGSPKQLGEILFENLGIEGGKKTRTGGYSTDSSVLENLSDKGHPIAEKVIEWRELSKLKSTYADALPESINPKTGRIHTSYSMAGTNTGRLASSEPNLQNIPVRSEQGRKIRSAFIPEKGCKLLSVDYSQVELRLAASLGNIQALKQAFKDGVDIHTATASQVFGIPLDEVSSEVRRQAKTINFGIIYGISGFGLAKQLGISNSEASNYIKKYLARFPELDQFMNKAKEFARHHGYVQTFYGRKCFVPGINDKNSAIRNFAERQSINAPLQGTAADIIKHAMITLYAELKKSGLKTKMLLQVHDELIFEVPENEMEKAEALVKKIMESSAKDLDVPLEADTGFGSNWTEAH